MVPAIWDWSWMRAVLRTTSNYALRLPASLKRAVEQVAREDGTMLNQFIVSAVAEKLAALKTADYFANRAARADFAGFDRLMRRPGGEAPGPDDALPENYARESPPADAVAGARRKLDYGRP
jgi:hypothetical protein